ncbi:MAG: ABC transporter permease [Gemmatimonas sp.]
MNFLSRWTRRINALLRSDDIERRMDDEMRLHLEMEVQDLQMQGLSAEQSRKRAAVLFGGVERFKEVARETRPTRLVENFSRDVQHAFRQLRRSRGFAISAAALLAVGIGGTATVFSVLNAIHFRPLPYPNADRLTTIQVRISDPRCGDRCLRDPDADEAESFRVSASSIEKLGTIRVTQGTLLLPSGARIMKGAAVSESLTELLALRVALGRPLNSADFRADAPGALLLSYSAWLSDFGGDSAVVGRGVTLGDATYVITGVLNRAAELGSPLYSYNAPNNAQYVIADRGALTAASSTSRVIARIRNGWTVTQLTAQLDAQLKLRMVRSANQPQTAGIASVQSMRTVLADGYRSSYWTLFAAVAIVLLITCLNVTGLFLARLSDRANELATRTALGASRSRLAQQIGTETFVISFAGGVGGVLLAFWGTLALRALPAGQLPFWSDVSVDTRTMLLVAVLTAVAGLILSLAPLAALSPHRLLVSLRETVGAGRSRATLRSTLVALQVALSVVLLGFAGLLTKVLVSAEFRDTGIAKHSMLYVLLDTPPFISDAQALALEQRISDEVRHIPGVVSVSVGGSAPRARVPRDRNAPRPPAMSIEGRPDALPATVAPTSADDVSPAHFETVGTRIVRGRSFTANDRQGNLPVAIIDEPTARLMFGAENALGKRVKFGAPSTDNPWMTIVGISAGLVNNALQPNASSGPHIYRSILQFPAAPSTVMIRFSNNTYSQKQAVRAAIKAADPLLPIAKMLTVEESVGLRLFKARFNTVVLNAFALFAVLLSCLGVYAAVTIAATSRQREIAIRVALGALRREIIVMLVRSATRPVAWGLCVGLIAAACGSRALTGLLYGASPTNPVIYSAVAAAMLLTSTVAALVPARRAVNADPAKMLRM